MQIAKLDSIRTLGDSLSKPLTHKSVMKTGSFRKTVPQIVRELFVVHMYRIRSGPRTLVWDENKSNITFVRAARTGSQRLALVLLY